MIAWRSILLIIFCVLFAHAEGAFAQGFARIPLVDQYMPSDDLVQDGEILRADQAHQLAQRGINLSVLNPAESAVWGPGRTITLDDELPFSESSIVEFSGALLSASGLFRFNARSGSLNAIIHLDKSLHVMLLRKNLLRKLGYKVPAMKWLPRLKVRFANLDEMKAFMESQVPRATLGAASRWVETQNDSSFTLVLRDVAVSIPQAEDHYNLSMGVPPQTLTSRTLRALIIPYALVDLGESVNKMEWVVGRESNNEIVLPHFTKGIFTTRMDDAKWALNLLEKLTLNDIKEIVQKAYFPDEVSTLLVEKIASRRNSLFNILKTPVTPLVFDSKVSEGQYLRNGKLTKQDWEGYGSRFAHGDPESPFKDFHWYALAKIQALAIDNIISRANQELSLFNPNEVRGDFYRDQFNRGLNHFVETGEFLQFPVGTWFSPTASVNISLSRDVVVGNYLGTDNLVQLADTIGYSAQVGGHLGIENFPEIQTLAVRGSMSISRSWTHLKPLRNLKNVFKEPYKNVVVPLLRWQLGKHMDRLHELGDSPNREVDWNLENDESKLSEIMNHISKSLGVGESIIFTERMNPTLSTNVNTTMLGTPVTFSLNASADILVIRRIQLYRKDSKTLHIYDDVGNGRGWSVDMSLERFIPILRFGLRRQNGDYSIRLHEMNIDPDVEDNPRLFDKAHALAEFIHSGSAELMEAIQKPHVVEAEFADKSSKFAFLFWRHKKLRSNTYFDIKSRDGLNGNFVTFNDEKQSGLNWEAFAKDIINYGLSQITQDVEWAPPVFQNPAETLGGVGKTNGVRFESRVNGQGHFDERFMRLTDRWEGWSAKVKTVKRYMREANERFGFTIFDEATLNNTEKLKLFNVAVHLNLYEAGLQRLTQIPEDTLVRLENRYEVEMGLAERGCSEREIRRRRLANGQRIESCGTLNSSIHQNRSCLNKIRRGKSEEEVSKCLMKLFRALYEDLKYADISSLLGRDNIFVHGDVNGFRNGDEVLNDPIQSNTAGRIGSQYWNGPFEKILRTLGIQSGEINGQWFRERI